MRSGTQRRWWLPAFIVFGVLCPFFVGSRLGSPADAQAELQTGMEGGILVTPVQIGRDSYGFAMVDTLGQTLWIYELNSRGPGLQSVETIGCTKLAVRQTAVAVQHSRAETRAGKDAAGGFGPTAEKTERGKPAGFRAQQQRF